MKIVPPPNLEQVDRPRTRRVWFAGAPLAGVIALVGFLGLPNSADQMKPGASDPKPDPKEKVPLTNPAARTPILVGLREVGGAVGVAGVAVSDDGRWLAVGMTDADEKRGGVKFFDRADGPAPELWWHWRDQKCHAVAFSPDGKLLAVGFTGHVPLRVWNVAEKKEVQFKDATFGSAEPEHITGLAFSPDGTLLAACGWGGEEPGARIRVWRVSDGSKIRDLTQPKEGRPMQQPLRNICFASDSKMLAAGVKLVPDSVPYVDVWEAENGKHLKSVQVEETIIGPCVAFARKELLLAYSSKATIELTRPDSYKREDSLPLAGNEPEGLAISPDGSLIAFSRSDVITLFDLSRKSNPKDLRGQTGSITALAFTADGRTLISGSEAKTVQEWAVPSRE